MLVWVQKNLINEPKAKIRGHLYVVHDESNKDEGEYEETSVIAVEVHARPGINTNDSLETERYDSKILLFS